MRKIVTGMFSSYAALTKAIHAQILADLTPIMKKVGEDIKKILTEYIMVNWYAAYHPMNYIRTYEIIDAITVADVVENANGKEVAIYFDGSKIHGEERPDGEWNAHMSVTGQTVGDAVVGWMNFGQASPIYSYSGIDFIGNVIDDLMDGNKIAKQINAALAAKGYICKIK
jgi:hypothetical protein